MHVLAGAAKLELEARLVGDALDRFPRAPVRLEGKREGQIAQHFEGGDGLGLELARVEPREPRHEREAVVAAAPLVAVAEPAADVAVVDLLGIVRERKRSGVLRDRGRQVPAHGPVVRREVRDAERLDRIDGFRGDDVEHLGHGLLDAGEKVRVERQLKDRRAARFHRELRVVDLVRPRAEEAGRFDAAKDVGDARPLAAAQQALCDGGQALAHGIEGAVGGFGRGTEGQIAEIEDLVARGRDRFDVLLLVRHPALDEEVEEGIGIHRRLRPQPLRHLHVQRGAVPAGQEPAEVGGGELEGGGGEVHQRGAPLAARVWRPRRASRRRASSPGRRG